MKKIMVLLLILSTSFLQAVSFKETCGKVLYTLFRPVPSIDTTAEIALEFYHRRYCDDATANYTWADNEKIEDFGTAGNFRATYPIEDSSSRDKLSRKLLLEKHNRLYIKLDPLVPPIVKDSTPSQTIEDYEATWQKQPLKDRFWWTIRYRRPYTYGLTLLKWGTEAAVVAGAAYGIYRGVKEYKKRQQAKLHIST